MAARAATTEEIFEHFGVSHLLDEQQVEAEVTHDTYMVLAGLAALAMKVDEANEYAVHIAAEVTRGKILVVFLTIFLVISQSIMICLEVI